MDTVSISGLLIVFEGTDGTGKSTQLLKLAEYLSALGYSVVTTREPTQGIYGQKIRKLYTNRGSCTPKEELELFLRDRKEHVDTVIRPSLAEGRIVLCDRYFLSTVAYQGGSGLTIEQLLECNGFAPDPDLALLFQAPVETGQQRITGARGETPNDFEQSADLLRVAEIFNSINRPYIQTVDAGGTIEEVHQQVIKRVQPLLAPISLAGKQ